jgi:hypothetical protein
MFLKDLNIIPFQIWPRDKRLLARAFRLGSSLKLSLHCETAFVSPTIQRFFPGFLFPALSIQS